MAFAMLAKPFSSKEMSFLLAAKVPTLKVLAVVVEVLLLRALHQQNIAKHARGGRKAKGHVKRKNTCIPLLELARRAFHLRRRFHQLQCREHQGALDFSIVIFNFVLGGNPFAVEALHC